MKASELITALQAAIKEHGDLEVTYWWLGAAKVPSVIKHAVRYRPMKNESQPPPYWNEKLDGPKRKGKHVLQLA